MLEEAIAQGLRQSHSSGIWKRVHRNKVSRHFQEPHAHLHSYTSFREVTDSATAIFNSGKSEEVRAMKSFKLLLSWTISVYNCTRPLCPLQFDWRTCAFKPSHEHFPAAEQMAGVVAKNESNVAVRSTAEAYYEQYLSTFSSESVLQDFMLLSESMRSSGSDPNDSLQSPGSLSVTSVVAAPLSSIPPAPLPDVGISALGFPLTSRSRGASRGRRRRGTVDSEGVVDLRVRGGSDLLSEPLSRLDEHYSSDEEDDDERDGRGEGDGGGGGSTAVPSAVTWSNQEGNGDDARSAVRREEANPSQSRGTPGMKPALSFFPAMSRKETPSAHRTPVSVEAALQFLVKPIETIASPVEGRPPLPVASPRSHYTPSPHSAGTGAQSEAHARSTFSSQPTPSIHAGDSDASDIIRQKGAAAMKKVKEAHQKLAQSAIVSNITQSKVFKKAFWNFKVRRYSINALLLPRPARLGP